MIDAASLCALVLAGGQASRMGGVDKGLLPFGGSTLAAVAVARLQQQSLGVPGQIAISANRNVASYESLGMPVWPDALQGYCGPLAGFLTGMLQAHARFDYLLTVPCDSPRFPLDLAQRLALSLNAQTDIAMAMAPDWQAADRATLYPQPVFCLMRTRLSASLQQFLQGGGRKIGAWTAAQRQVKVAFDQPGDDPRAFANVNTLDDLHQLEPP